MPDKPPKDDGNDLVLTPGGPRPRRLVQTVRGDQLVRFDRDGAGVTEPRTGKAARAKPDGGAGA